MRKIISILIFVSLIGSINAQERVSHSNSKYFYDKLGKEVNSIILELLDISFLENLSPNTAGFNENVYLPFIDLATKIESRNDINYVLHLKGINASRVGIKAQFVLDQNDTLFLEDKSGKIVDLVIGNKHNCEDNYGCPLFWDEDELVIRFKTNLRDSSRINLKVTHFMYFYANSLLQNPQNKQINLLKSEIACDYNNYNCAFAPCFNVCQNLTNDRATALSMSRNKVAFALADP